MKYYNIKNTDLKVSNAALGCMRIESKSVEEVEALVAAALDAGINFFDHADIYGGGKSEELFGEVLKRNPGYREKMILQTKCAIVPGKRYDFSKEYIMSCVNGSLKRLQTDYIDILLLHRPDALCDPAEVAETFDELYKSGKVKYFGVSNHTGMQIELLKKYVKQPLIINQLQLSVIHSVLIDSGLNMNMVEPYAADKDGATLDYCRLNDILIQPWSSLQASWADGTFIDNPKYPKTNEVLASLAEKYHTNKTAVSLAWLLRHPAGFQPIIGTTSPFHLKQALEAENFELTRQEWYDLYLAEGKPLP
ncbi:aldo/keto reductase [Hespellia stercorisuis]|uniref:Predicted oxidoreductase n=1 Tax=Hespellia stercorisuis DSM 15480 TaxID=1121950 RepID=A0A1M6S7B9_9FIRM|nr:aldo/keto reductase [Hespellia stercorisuis]SHK40672.1 Predicted oxidoreductase [Hespellia stercorisuis DSM 15480]